MLVKHLTLLLVHSWCSQSSMHNRTLNKARGGRQSNLNEMKDRTCTFCDNSTDPRVFSSKRSQFGLLNLTISTGSGLDWTGLRSRSDTMFSVLCTCIHGWRMLDNVMCALEHARARSHAHRTPFSFYPLQILRIRTLITGKTQGIAAWSLVRCKVFRKCIGAH